MDFQLRYFRWFLDNYTHYKYVGKKAKELRKELDEFYLSQDVPNVKEMRALYSKFLVQYKGDILTTAGGKGVFPKTGDYYLVFEVEDYLVPLSFISYYQRVESSYLEEVLDFLVSQRLKIYTEGIARKNHLVEKNDVAIRRMDNHDREFVILKENLITFAVLMILPLLMAVSLFVPSWVELLHLSFANLVVLQVVLFLLATLYGLIICGFIADNQTLLKGKQINLGLFDLEKDINDTSRKLQNINKANMIKAITTGRKVRSRVKEPNIDAELYKFDVAIDEIEKGKIIKTKIKKKLYEASNVILDLTVIFTYLSVYFESTIALWVIVTISVLEAVVIFFSVRSVVRRINIRAVIANFVISLAMAIISMGIILWLN